MGRKWNKYPKMMKKFNRYVGIRDNNIVINKIKDDIKLLLYNNRNMVNIQKITDIKPALEKYYYMIDSLYVHFTSLLK